MNQTETILAHLTMNRYIDPITAIKEYLIMRLAARIKNLRDMGYNIKTRRVMKNDKLFAVYELI